MSILDGSVPTNYRLLLPRRQAVLCLHCLVPKTSVYVLFGTLEKTQEDIPVSGGSDACLCRADPSSVGSWSRNQRTQKKPIQPLLTRTESCLSDLRYASVAASCCLFVSAALHYGCYKELYLALQVQKLLGKGSYGIVYRVKRLSDGGVYALKEADVRKMSPLERADAVNEIRLLASVKHPNVVRYNEAFLDGKAGPHSARNSYKACYTC